MIVCADRYLSRRFDARTYTCWHFVRDVWRDLTGRDLGLPAYSARVESLAEQHTSGATFVRLLRAESPCLALALRPRVTPHVGVVLRRNVLHLTEKGARYEPIEAFGEGFAEVAFYRPAPALEPTPQERACA
jgi:hypothetical protein